MKLPYGGFETPEQITQEPIPWDADPAPLLAEIARCAYEARPMPPRLAQWFCSIQARGLVVVKPYRRRGRPRTVTRELYSRAIDRLEELQKSGVGSDEAVDRVKTELKLKASRPTIFGWIASEKKSLQMLAQDAGERAIELHREDAVRAFRQKALEGMPAHEALDWVMQNLPSALNFPDRERHEIWQWEALRALDGERTENPR